MKAKTQKIEQRYNNVNCAGMVYGTAKPILYPPRSTLRHYIYLRMVPNEKNFGMHGLDGCEVTLDIEGRNSGIHGSHTQMNCKRSNLRLICRRL